MAVSSNSYGTADDVGKKVPRFANNTQTFDYTTNPTITSVESWIDEVSAMVNGVLASLGFSIPVTQSDAVSIMQNIVTELVAARVEGVRGSGRYAPTNKSIARYGLMTIISEDIRAYLNSISAGLEDLGVSRTTSNFGRMGFREFDNQGSIVHPVFSRRQFGESFKNWDKLSTDT